MRKGIDMIEWVRTKDRLPPENDLVLVLQSSQLAIDDLSICEAKYIDEEWHIVFGLKLYNVPYWAPLNMPDISKEDNLPGVELGFRMVNQIDNRKINK